MESCGPVPRAVAASLLLAVLLILYQLQIGDEVESARAAVPASVTPPTPGSADLSLVYQADAPCVDGAGIAAAAGGSFGCGGVPLLPPLVNCTSREALSYNGSARLGCVPLPPGPTPSHVRVEREACDAGDLVEFLNGSWSCLGVVLSPLDVCASWELLGVGQSPGRAACVAGPLPSALSPVFIDTEACPDGSVMLHTASQESDGCAVVPPLLDGIALAPYDLNVTGDVEVNDDASVAGVVATAALTASSLQVSDDVAIEGNLTCRLTTTVGGRLDVGGQLALSTTTDLVARTDKATGSMWTRGLTLALYGEQTVAFAAERSTVVAVNGHAHDRRVVELPPRGGVVVGLLSANNDPPPFAGSVPESHAQAFQSIAPRVAPGAVPATVDGECAPAPDPSAYRSDGAYHMEDESFTVMKPAAAAIDNVGYSVYVPTQERLYILSGDCSPPAYVDLATNAIVQMESGPSSCSSVNYEGGVYVPGHEVLVIPASSYVNAGGGRGSRSVMVLDVAVGGTGTWRSGEVMAPAITCTTCFGGVPVYVPHQDMVYLHRAPAGSSSAVMLRFHVGDDRLESFETGALHISDFYVTGASAYVSGLCRIYYYTNTNNLVYLDVSGSNNVFVSEAITPATRSSIGTPYYSPAHARVYFFTGAGADDYYLDTATSEYEVLPGSTGAHALVVYSPPTSSFYFAPGSWVAQYEANGEPWQAFDEATGTYSNVSVTVDADSVVGGMAYNERSNCILRVPVNISRSMWSSHCVHPIYRPALPQVPIYPPGVGFH